MSDYFIVDVESGGVPEKGSSLLTLYGLIADEKFRKVAHIDLKIKPDDGVYKVEPRAMAVNKIDLVAHDESPETIPYSQAKTQFKDFVTKYSLYNKLTIVGHSVDFDIAFMKKLIGNHEWPQRFNRRIVDTKSMANFLCICGVLPREELGDCSLKSLAKYFGLDYDGAHLAEFDAKLTRTVAQKLIECVKERQNKE